MGERDNVGLTGDAAVEPIEIDGTGGREPLEMALMPIGEKTIGGHTLGELTQGPVNPHSRDNSHPDDIGCAYVRQLTGRQTLCVECPLAECIYDNGNTRQILQARWRREARRQEVLRLHREGVPVAEIAKRTGYGRRWIYRITS